MEEDNRHLVVFMITAAMIFVLSLLLMLCSCGTFTKYIPVPEYHYRDSTRTIVINDTTREVKKEFQRDSVFIMLSGDTTIIKEYHYREDTKMLEHLRSIIDSMRAVKGDSVRVPYPVITEKPVHKLWWWQIVLLWTGIAGILTAAARIVIWLRKKGILNI